MGRAWTYLEHSFFFDHPTRNGFWKVLGTFHGNISLSHTTNGGKDSFKKKKKDSIELAMESQQNWDHRPEKKIKEKRPKDTNQTRPTALANVGATSLSEKKKNDAKRPKKPRKRRENASEEPKIATSRRATRLFNNNKKEEARRLTTRFHLVETEIRTEAPHRSAFPAALYFIFFVAFLSVNLEPTGPRFS